MEFAEWCNICNAEQATTRVEIEIDNQWIELNVGLGCLTRMQEDGKLEL